VARPASTKRALPTRPRALERRHSILGICYGLHLMAQALGGKVVSFERKEFGPATVSVAVQDGLFTGLEPEQSVWMSHGDSIERLPDGFQRRPAPARPLRGRRQPRSAHVRHPVPPEVVHTKRGRDILRNFVVDIAGARQTWTSANFIASNVEEIRAASMSTAGLRAPKAMSCALYPAEWIRPWRRPWFIGPWATA